MTEKRVQIPGEGGTLGSAVRHAFSLAGYEVLPAPRDIAETASIDVVAPIVVNCAGIVKQRHDVSPAVFTLVNSYAPHRLAQACQFAGSRLIHISTDCVFGGLPGPSHELSQPCPENLYGASKLAGEVVDPPHLTVRTSFVGPGPRGLWADIAAGKPQRASANMLWTGLTTWTLAWLLVQMAERPDITGLLHLPAPAINRWYLVNLLATELDVPISILRDDSYVRDRRLASVKYDQLELPEIPPIVDQLSARPKAVKLEIHSSKLGLTSQIKES